jgi:SAM-dependent methyltransferase
MGRWSRLVAPLLLGFANIPDGGRILDVGSGTGSLANEIAARLTCCRILGIDLSEHFVAYAKVLVPNANVHFEVGNAQRLSFVESEFDASLSLLVFNFIPNPRQALGELKRVTRPGGQISAATWDYGDRMEMLRIFWDAAIELDRNAERSDERNMPLCRSGELLALWKEGGLTDVEEQPLEIAMQFRSFDDFWQPFLTGQGPAGAYVQQLLPERRLDLRDQVKCMLPRSRQHGAFELRGRAWAVRGRVPQT